MQPTRRLTGEQPVVEAERRDSALRPWEPLQPFYLVLLQMGFAQPASHLTAGKLLPHHFTLTDIDSPSTIGGMFLLHFP